MNKFDFDVVVVGSGPSGIGAATALVKAGIKNIVVFERETRIGGIPRHTNHPSFGLLVFKRPMSGPKFIKCLLRQCPGVRFETTTTVVAVKRNGQLDLATLDGLKTIRARHIIIATGARETPRHGRLISGLRPSGIITTGALQQFVNTIKMYPFLKPVIVGTELVSFSAIWTLRAAGIKPVAMIEKNSRITAYRPAALFARLLGVPIYYNTIVADIGDMFETRKIEILNANSESRTLACDSIIFSGNFVGENSLAHDGHLKLNSKTRIPKVDQNWLSSDLQISVVGNATHPADMGDQCYIEGKSAGLAVAAILQQGQIIKDTVEVQHDEGIRLTTPSIVRIPKLGRAHFDLCMHVTKPYTGIIEIRFGHDIAYRRLHRCMPARRVRLKNISLNISDLNDQAKIHISLKSRLRSRSGELPGL
ncbi:MAG: pyridine nucleotide-disulfide oxidoreductase [Hyphomicrobiales bacterium]|nr:MAG: pyridine nucleotide-disulfide oxidoreductase [Hyphomicrobiales bacterium]